MRWRIAALIAVAGIAATPAVSDASQPARMSMLNITVRPPSGAPGTHFAVSFRAAQASSRSVRDTYRIAAAVLGHGGCQSSAAATVAPGTVGATVRVVLSPSRPAGWCVGTFRGHVWDVITFVCPPGRACPDIVVAPRMVGTFSFRVTRS